jgi:Methyltransferase domain
MVLSPTACLRGLADDGSARSLSHRLRERRFRLFDRLVALIPGPVSVIDLGGTNEFWERRGWAGRDDVLVTLVNLEPQDRRHANIRPVVGDATDLSDHPDGSFDIAFSNSVIEHLFDFEAQSRMAREVRRVGRAYWVQTPNFWFPVEPHFLVPFWHWLPEDVRVEILSRRGVGWAGRCRDREVARRVVREHRLMRRTELARLFPGATILGERFGGLVKSWTAIDGFPLEPASIG